MAVLTIEYFPGLHKVQEIDLYNDEYVPGQQSEQKVRLNEYFPGEHDMHVSRLDAPDIVEYLPTRQE